MRLIETETETGAGGDIARVALNRPEQRNAVSSAMLQELEWTLEELGGDRQVRAIVLSGRGPDFCAGADVVELAAARASAPGAEYAREFEGALRALARCPVPVIARVHGAALGAGCQLAVACDLAVAAHGARMGIPSSRLGIVINFENVERLTLAVGAKRAGELLFAGRILTGEEAASWGLVNRVVPEAELDAAVESMAESVAAGAPLSVRASKRGIRAVLEHLTADRDAGEGHPAAEFDAMAEEAFVSEDLAEGLRALRERRPPNFRGR